MHLIQTNVPLCDKVWFGTGGIAHLYAEPTTVSEFADLIAYAQEKTVPLFILGQGANILVSDDGFEGLVIRPQLCAITLEQKGDSLFVTAEAGVTIDHLIEYCLANQILGLEEFSGIPGTVGGSVFINLHYYEFLLSQFVSSATVIHKNSNTCMVVPSDWFEFGYNKSKLLQESFYLVSATFKLRFASHDETVYARGRRAEIIRHRIKRYPYKNTCGSFFRNFHEDEVSYTLHGKKMIYVAYYLDKAGIKGSLSVGGASVSYQHANMIVTDQTATSDDIVQLAIQMQTVVYKEFGIIPQPECRLIGFKEYPLLKSISS